MPNRSSKQQRPLDLAETACGTFMEEFSEGRSGKNPAAVALGRLGGLKGGKARSEKLTVEQRSEIAKKAAHARWHKDE